MNSIQRCLAEKSDADFAAFTARTIPSIDPKSILGVRTPDLRAFAKELLAVLKNAQGAGKPQKAGAASLARSGKIDFAAVQKFLDDLPHKYFEENQLHGFVVSGIKDFDLCVAELERFLPCVDNWATCDQTSPVCFKKNRAALLPLIKKWIKSERVYTVRFAIGMLLRHFLDEDFKPEYLEMVAAVRSDEYYIKMEVAWYFAEALAKQWDAALPYIGQRRLEAWTHNKAIQKARESFRVPDERKELLAGLKVALPG